jgi:hypothetical protein
MYQIVEMSHKEKVEMYRLIDKEKLIEMLIESNNHLHRVTTPLKVVYHDQQKIKLAKEHSFLYSHTEIKS